MVSLGKNGFCGQGAGTGLSQLRADRMTGYRTVYVPSTELRPSGLHQIELDEPDLMTVSTNLPFSISCKPNRATGRRRASVAALLMMSVFSGAFLTGSATDASAQNFLQRIFTPKEKRLQEVQAKQEAEQRKKATSYKVAPPKIYTYKPDVWKTVSLASLAKLNTAAVQPTTETSGTDGGTSVATEIPAPVLTEFDKARPALKSLSFKALPEVGEALEAYYREHPDYIWATDGELNSKALAAIEVLGAADEFALDPKDYVVGMLKPAAQAQVANVEAVDDSEIVDARAAAVMAFEMELSAAVLTYVLDAKRGRVDPNRLSEYHDLPRHDVDLVAALRAIQSGGDVAGILEGQHPQDGNFAKLKARLAELRAEDEAEDPIVIAPGTFLKEGRTSPEVKNIVAAIRKNGSAELKEKHAETLAAYAGEEDYNTAISAMVRSYQKEHGLAPDGIVGKNTIRALVGETNAAKIAKLELAMERRRWLPEDLGERRVFINQPAFMATYYEGQSEPLSMRVVVGKKSNQTNFFYDNIEIVEYNPYWGVPYSIIVNEMIPKLARDPSYLDRSGYEVSTASGKRVSSSSVNWYAVASKQQSVNVRQRPGSANALGEVKILFPNKHHIYMHDTPAKSLFNKDSRAFSHGCVRLHDPKAMAAAVLGKSKDYVSGQIARGKNQQERVQGNLPVYVSYFTAWPSDAGEIEFFDDVYDRDRHLLKALEMTDESRAAARS